MTVAVLVAALTAAYTLLTHQAPTRTAVPTARSINTLWSAGDLQGVIKHAPAAADNPSVGWSGRAQILRNLAWAYEDTAEAATDTHKSQELAAKARKTWERLRAHCEDAPTTAPGAINTAAIDYWAAYALRGLAQEDRARELWRDLVTDWLRADTDAMDLYDDPGESTHRGSFPLPAWAAPALQNEEPPAESGGSEGRSRGVDASRAAHALGMLGEHDASIEAMEVAARRRRLPAPDHLRSHRAFEGARGDPRFEAIATWIGESRYWASVRRLLVSREHEVLEHLATLQTETDPGDPEGWLSLAFALRAQGWPDDARPPENVWAALLQATEPNESGRLRSFRREHRAWALRGLGRGEQARRLFLELGRDLATRIYDNIERADSRIAHRAAAAFAMAGRTDDALDMLAIAAGDPGFDRPYVMVDPALESVRDHPRFAEAISPNRGSPRRLPPPGPSSTRPPTDGTDTPTQAP